MREQKWTAAMQREHEYALKLIAEKREQLDRQAESARRQANRPPPPGFTPAVWVGPNATPALRWVTGAE
jgi:hypothetical protein